MASCDRAYDHSLHPKYRWYDQSWGVTIYRTINRSIVRPIVRSIVASYDRSYDQSWQQTICNRRFEILNMTIDLATTDFALAITHDIRVQSYVLSTICLRFQHFSFAGRCNLIVNGAVYEIPQSCHTVVVHLVDCSIPGHLRVRNI